MGILDFFFPKRCLECGRIGKYFCDQHRYTIKVIGEREAICPVCERLAIDGVTHPGCRSRYSPNGLTSFFRYDGIVRKAVKALKYRLVFDLAEEFISLVPTSFFNNGTMQQLNNGLFVPIPLHPLRFRQRGFNQAEVLGRLIAKKLHVSIRIDILRRTRHTTPQVEMKKREARLKNMEKVFSIKSAAMKHSDNVILFDDVFTTGATMRSAANVLKRGGAKFVWVITMAR